MEIEFLLYTLHHAIFFLLWITYSKTFSMKPQKKINNLTQFMRTVFKFDFALFEYLIYNDFSSVS